MRRTDNSSATTKPNTTANTDNTPSTEQSAEQLVSYLDKLPIFRNLPICEFSALQSTLPTHQYLRLAACRTTSTCPEDHVNCWIRIRHHFRLQDIVDAQGFEDTNIEIVFANLPNDMDALGYLRGTPTPECQTTMIIGAVRYNGLSNNVHLSMLSRFHNAKVELFFPEPDDNDYSNVGCQVDSFITCNRNLVSWRQRENQLIRVKDRVYQNGMTHSIFQ